jgi:hypothetical protein
VKEAPSLAPANATAEWKNAASANELEGEESSNASVPAPANEPPLNELPCEPESQSAYSPPLETALSENDDALTPLNFNAPGCAPLNVFDEKTRFEEEETSAGPEKEFCDALNDTAFATRKLAALPETAFPSITPPENAVAPSKLTPTLKF